MKGKDRLLNDIIYNNLIVRSCNVLMKHTETLDIRKQLKALKTRAEARYIKLVKRMESIN
jgi:hypothetical protein